jgi:hypothetical protein
MVDGLRALIVTGNTASLPADIGVLIVATLIISIVSSVMYPMVVI